MEMFFTLLHYAWSFFLILSVIVFIHEFGHYIVAKWCGVRIVAFSIGFGRELFGWTDHSGTRWKFSLVPLGGYVKMLGDANAASTPDAAQNAVMTEEEKAHAFHYKPLWKKALIVAAGPLFNFLLTVVVLTGLVYTNGIPTMPPVVGEIVKGSAAEESGLEPGDVILSVDKNLVRDFNDIPRLLATNLGTPVLLEIQRQQDIFTLTITPKMQTAKDAFGNDISRPLIGIQSQPYAQDYEPQQLSLSASFMEGVKRTYLICDTTLQAVGQILVGERSANELQGPIGIAKLSGQATQMNLSTIFWFIAMLSANLGLINLFPIPLLDGGHLLYYTIEAATGRPLAEKIQEYGFRLGFALVASLMAFTLINDLRNIF